MERDISMIAGGDENSAEATAALFLRHLLNLYPPEMAHDVKWIVSYADAPQLVCFLINPIVNHIK